MANVGRIAMRVEGDWWVAYFAPQDTMEAALELGRIRMSIVEGHGERREEFLAPLKSFIADRINEHAGVQPQWLEQPAPQHERAGRG